MLPSLDVLMLEVTQLMLMPTCLTQLSSLRLLGIRDGADPSACPSILVWHHRMLHPSPVDAPAVVTFSPSSAEESRKAAEQVRPAFKTNKASVASVL